MCACACNLYVCGVGWGAERLEVEVNQTERLMLFIYYKVSLVLFCKFYIHLSALHLHEKC